MNKTILISISLDDKPWGSKPYAHKDVTNLLLKDNKMNQKVKQLTK